MTLILNDIYFKSSNNGKDKSISKTVNFKNELVLLIVENGNIKVCHNTHDASIDVAKLSILYLLRPMYENTEITFSYGRNQIIFDIHIQDDGSTYTLGFGYLGLTARLKTLNYLKELLNALEFPTMQILNDFNELSTKAKQINNIERNNRIITLSSFFIILLISLYILQTSEFKSFLLMVIVFSFVQSIFFRHFNSIKKNRMKQLFGVSPRK